MDIKTVDASDGVIIDNLYRKQKENISKMRTALLSFSDENGVSTRQAVQGITAMRIYHQLIRIVRYLELMDKLEFKLYESIEHSIDISNVQDAATWAGLLTIQEKLQKSMIESHKLLQPYLDIQEFTVMDLTNPINTSSTPTILMNSEDRDELRSKAQLILDQLESTDLVEK